jgi:glutamate racemase
MIGIFDSGVGGLTVYQEVRRLLPQAEIVYLADRGNAPYGDRSLAEVGAIAAACTEHLLHLGASMVVVACNTASAAALHPLRAQFPGVPFVGMEPALKPAAAMTRSGVVGVLATAATFQGELFSSLLDRYTAGLEVITQACVSWAEMVEAGVVDGDGATQEVNRYLSPVLDRGADTLVLGCTHYPFLQNTIATIAGPQRPIIDPAAAVATQVARVATEPGTNGRTTLQSTGDPTTTRAIMSKLTGLDLGVEAVTLPMNA